MAFKDPSEIVNRAMDALGCGIAIGSLDDGTPVTETARRTYGPMLRQLLRAAQWNFARVEGALQLLGSATGQDPSGQPISALVDPPWQFAYAWPVDGVAAIWVPWHLTPLPTNPPQPPLVTNLNVPTQPYVRRPPARFLVSSSNHFPAVTGQTPWDQLADLSTTEGVGPVGRRVILTNVPCARLVYTRLVLSIEEWDPMFEETMVAFMAQRLALIAVKDRKEAIVMRNAQISIVKDQLCEARTRNANEAGFPQTQDHVPDWIRSRRFGATRWGAGGLGGGGEVGVLGYGYDSIGFSDGSVF